jgi:alpha-methylacyl-CoA racemase
MPRSEATADKADDLPDGVGPLSGVRIVEFAAIGPVPYGAMLLGDLGAEILMIDRAGATWPQLPILSRCRSSLVLDLKRGPDLNVAQEAIRHADVLIEGFRPGVMERLGLGPEPALHENPRLIYTRVTGWGQDGPLSRTAGHDINYIALSGLLGLLGRDGAPPDPPLNWLGDYAAGSLFMVTGILASLLERSRSGMGQVLDISIVDAGASLLAPILGMQRAGLLDLEPDKNLLAGRAPFYRTYRCSDNRDLAVGPLEPEFRRILADRLGIEPETIEGEFEDGSCRIAALFRSRPRASWENLFDGTDACVTPVLSPEEAARHPHLAARQTFIESGAGIEPAPAPRFSRTPCRIQAAPDGETLLDRWRRCGGQSMDTDGPAASKRA